jgi:hypothetical protein
MLNTKHDYINFKITGAICAGITYKSGAIYAGMTDKQTGAICAGMTSSLPIQKTEGLQLLHASHPVKWSHLPRRVEPYTPE